jgi:hypothetical protein
MITTRLRGKRWTALYDDANGKQKSGGTYDTEKEAREAA